MKSIHLMICIAGIIAVILVDFSGGIAAQVNNRSDEVVNNVSAPKDSVNTLQQQNKFMGAYYLGYPQIDSDDGRFHEYVIDTGNFPKVKIPTSPYFFMTVNPNGSLRFPFPFRNMRCVPPVLVDYPEPYYTDAAKKANVSGIITLSGVVRQNGVIGNVEVVSGLGYGLDEVAINTITTKWRFQPATCNDMPINYRGTIEIELEFKLSSHLTGAGEPSLM